MMSSGVSSSSSGGAANNYLLNSSSSTSFSPSGVTVAADFLLEPSLTVPLLQLTQAADGGVSEAADRKIVFTASLVLKIVGILALILVIVVGNGMVMFAVRLDRTILALSQSSFLFSMALADALVGIFVLPMALLQIVYEYWPLPPIVCILYRCLDIALCTASILHLCAISMDRFWSLRIDYTRHHRYRNMRIMIIVVWLLSLVISLPSALPSKFDLQYLGNYLPSSGEDDDNSQHQQRAGGGSVLSASSHFFISPFYILDMQQQQQQQLLIENEVNNGHLLETPAKSGAVTVFFTNQQPPTTTVTLPPRPRGNNKVLQSLDDVGGADCAGPTPLEWLFPPYDDAGPTRAAKGRPCPPKTVNKAASAMVVPPAPAVLSAASDNILSSSAYSDGFTDNGSVGLYHCTLIDDIFYTFASASMSFYIPLVITIIMNVLTFWIAQRTAKAAIKRMHASNPAALMLRAVIPMPIGRQSNAFSTFASTGDGRESTVIDDGGLLSPCSIHEFGEQARKVNNNNNNNNNNDGKKLNDNSDNNNNNNTTTSSGGASNNNNNNNNDQGLEMIQPVTTGNDRLGMTRVSTGSASFQNMLSDQGSRKMKNGTVQRSVSCKNKNNNNRSRDQASHRSFDNGIDASESLLSGEKTRTNSQQQLTTKNLITSVLQNVALFSGNRQAVLDNATTKVVNEYDRTVHAVRAEKKRRAKQRERKAAVVLIIVTVTFIVCWLPFFTVFPLTRVFEPGAIPSQVYEATVWLGYVNSAVNPVIYTIFNEEFRRAFTNIFLCRWKLFWRY